MADMNATKIAQLNDAARKSLAFQVMLTRGVDELDGSKRGRVVEAMRSFSNFTKGNDPYGEHDFGSFTVEGDKFLFKFDYYDKGLEYGSEDPTNPAVTTRVLTLMFASEY